MRDRARAVVIGGGVIGCSVLYHLAKLGWTDSLLVEQYQLTYGSTWHSAGLVGQLRSSLGLTRMMQYSAGLYAELKELTGNDPGWHQLGGLRLASSQPRLEEIRRQAAWARTFGLPINLLALAWGGGMLVNFAWPRAASNPTPYQVVDANGHLQLNFGWHWLNNRPVLWIVFVAVALVGAVYFVLVQRTKPAHLEAPEGEVVEAPPATTPT